MKVKIADGWIIVSARLCAPRPSSSGKTLLLSSTRGVFKSTETVEGKRVKIIMHTFIDTD